VNWLVEGAHVRSTGLGSEPSVSLLQSLVESGEAERDGESYLLKHGFVAMMLEEEAHLLRLPPTLPFSFRMRSVGNLVRADSALRVDWFRDGIPAPLLGRAGSIAEFDGGDPYRIPSPIFELLEATERFNDSGSAGQDRLVLWAEVKRWIDADELLDDQYLRQLTVHIASAFTIRPTLTETGDADFQVLPGRWESDSTQGDVSDERSFSEVLPAAHREAFETRFRQLKGRSAYAINAGTILIATPEVSRALREVREVRDEGASAIRAFARQPQAILRARLEGDPEAVEIAVNLDEIFGDYGARVTGVGLWAPKVVPWIKKPSDPWLPPESLGVMIDGKPLEIEKEDVAELAATIERAIEGGKPSVTYAGVEIPATPEVLETVRTLEGAARPKANDERRQPSPDEEATHRGRTVLEVVDNLENAQFLKTKRVVERPAEVDLRGRMISKLFPHQDVALEWLKEAWTAGEPGVLLADDMGLGKTVQALAFMSWLRGLMDTGQLTERPMLVVAPTGLLKNWIEERAIHLKGDGLGSHLEVFGPGLKSLRRGGRDTDTGEIGLDLSAISNAGWVLTSYETYRDYQLSFGRVSWSLAVFDEVQKVKNPAAAMTDAAKSVNAGFVLALTGTPVENRLADLWSIMDLTQPGLLGSLRDFSSEWESEGADLTGLREILTSGAPPPMLRRLKEDHIDGLPTRRFVYARGTMSPEQAHAYDDAIREARGAPGGATLQALGRIRSVSLHPHARGTETLVDYVRRSARLRLTVEWLHEIQAKGEKALVFAESRTMQATLAEIATELLGLPHRPLLINGAVTGPARQERVNRFQKRGSGFDMMILSPKAGGVGLTLTAANHVIHLSRWWNPAVEDQCTDRVYRIGQGRPVMVYHPLAEHPTHGTHSFDVRLDDLLRRKRRLSRAVLAPAGASHDDFDQLFREVTQTEREVASRFDLSDVDVLDGVGFEGWVAGQLKAAGYQVDRTPWSGDAGVDLVARSSGVPTLIVQCKHTQTGGTLQRSAVEEVLEGMRRYEEGDGAHAVVITNASQVAGVTEQLAFSQGVHLWTRSSLGGLSDPRVYLGPLRG
jgi:hypothetical protein